MAFKPASTCCMAWLPVIAPSAFTYGSVWSMSQRRSDPRHASVCSICTVPRSRTTSLAEYGRSMPVQRGSCIHLSCKRCSGVCLTIEASVYVCGMNAAKGADFLPPPSLDAPRCRVANALVRFGRVGRKCYHLHCGHSPAQYQKEFWRAAPASPGVETQPGDAARIERH